MKKIIVDDDREELSAHSEELINKNEKKATFRTAEVVVLLILTCAISLSMGVVINANLSKMDENKNSSMNSKEIEEFIENYNYVVNNYYGEIDKKQLIDDAIAGMLEGLGDEYSNFIKENEDSEFNIRLNGQYQGIGIEISKDKDNNIVVVNVFDDSPAKKANLKIGDIIKSINGDSTTGKTTTEISSYIRNSKSNDFKLEIIRDKKEMKINIKRDSITLKTVESKVYNNNDKKIGYISIEIFATNTYTQFKAELNELEKQNINSLIIDVRNNPGGYLDVVEKMVSLFLDTSKVIYQIEVKGVKEKKYSTGSVTKKYPIIILANQNSASASELLASSLQEEYGATVVGMKTYGKGTVQELQKLSSGNQYKMTTKKWLTPKGNWINEKGVKPNVEIELSDKYYDNPIEANDTQLQKALEILNK